MFGEDLAGTMEVSGSSMNFDLTAKGVVDLNLLCKGI